MLSLTVLYDPECGLCRRAHEWLAEQSKLVELNFVPCASDEARKRYPQLNHDLTKKDLTVISDDGAVYFGPKAWLMVLWALTRYRDWAYRLADAGTAAHYQASSFDDLTEPLPDQSRRRTHQVNTMTRCAKRRQRRRSQRRSDEGADP